MDNSQAPASAIVVYGADHNAEWQSERLKAALARMGDVIDAGELEPKLDNYVDISSRVCNLTLAHNGIGVNICGTGIGVSIVDNKHRGIYAARCVTPVDAKDCKVINNANVLCLSAKTDIEQNVEIIAEFFATRFEAIDRRMDRVRRIALVESQNFRGPQEDGDSAVETSGNGSSNGSQQPSQPLAAKLTVAAPASSRPKVLARNRMSGGM
jgi:ribose 5-phosphate isomerase B